MLNLLLNCGFVVLGVVATVAVLMAMSEHTMQQPYRARSPPRRRESSPPRRRQTSPERETLRRRRGSNNGSQHQKDLMTDELRAGILVCTICLTYVDSDESIFVCRETCGNIFHLSCIRKWASSGNTRSWNCPYCFHEYRYLPPMKNLCMCGQTENPEPLHGGTPHCCLKRCQCGDLCHPGACSTE